MTNASALLEVLLRTDRGAGVLTAAGDADWLAPDLINVEVLSTLRRLERGGILRSERAHEAVADLSDAPLERVSTLPLTPLVWARRHNLSAYDACNTVTTTVNTKGQVTIPEELRTKYGFPPGTKVVWIERDGELIPRPLRSLETLYGYLSDESGEGSLTARLLAERRAEREREDR